MRAAAPPHPDAGADPAEVAELSDSLTTAFLLMLEELSPTERLTVLLADVFDEPFSSVAEILDKSESAVRQQAVRARRKLRAAAPSGRPGGRRRAAPHGRGLPHRHRPRATSTR